MKKETKAKIKVKLNRAWEVIKPWLAPIAIGTTVCAAWEGYSNSVRNERELRSLRDFANKVDIGAGTWLEKHDDRLDALEKKQKELLSKAVGITEGKEDEVA